MKIRTLLPCLFGLMIVLGIIQGGFAIYSVKEMETQIGNIAQRIDRTILVGEMENKFSDVRRHYAIMLGADTPEAVANAAVPVRNAIKVRETVFEHFGSTITNPQTRERFTTLVAAVAAYENAGDEFIRLMAAGRQDDAKLLISSTMSPAGEKAATVMQDMVKLNSDLAVVAEKNASAASAFASLTTIVAIVVVAVLAIAAALMSFFRIARPIDEITSSMTALAAGDTARDIPHGARQDELGDMAAAVAVFRSNALERERLEREAEANRSLSEQERMAREEQKAKEAADVQFAVEGLASGLRHLADGDMTFRLQSAFVGQLDVLRTNYNESIEKLQDALRSVGENARMIDAGANEIRSATEDLSKRTEQQAASVEETAAALEQVTTAVKDSSVKAGQAGDLVARTRAGAERSGQVVRKAVVAMQEIEKSSNEISNIIGVIDDIAFQTNLLALNAGVEAARAGEAGKGFAVVAQEVRELAQRSANAAKEIKALITKSGEQVRDGVELVGETGEALEAIVAEVQDINQNVSAIAASAREQSTGLSEINSAVNQMDQGTQQNASMVEQSTAATYGLASQAASLIALLSQFKLDAGATAFRASDAQSRTASHRPQPSPAIRSVDTDNAAAARARPSPARALGNRLASAFGGQTAAAVATDNWTEF